MSNRPISPHLSIYKPQITSVLSILHRITGFGLYIGATIFVWWIVDNVYQDFESTCNIWKFFNNTFGKILLFLWSFALFYHLCNGIRHLCWDIGLGFELKTVTYTGWLVILLSTILTLGCWYYVVW